ncbi:two-component system connector SafA, partial [Escherichia coli]|nr:Two-protein-system connector protein SafA [Escherichia coli]EJJ0000700.1 two-component system connector SafA [Escherichia coli]
IARDLTHFIINSLQD